jgi:hypothetical protein
MNVRVQGNATAEELAVVLALFAQPDRPPEASRYEQWRATRLAALRSATHYAERPAHR